MIDSIVGAQVMEYQYIAPRLRTFASECMLIQIIGKK